MRWNHPSPNMTSGGLSVAEPRCRPRVYKSRVTGAWFFYCPAHPGKVQYADGDWESAWRLAWSHATSYRLRE